MGLIFRCVLAASATLRSLGAEVIATPLNSDPIPISNTHHGNNFLGDTFMSSKLPHLSLSALFVNAAQQKAMSDRLHAAALHDAALSNTHETSSAHHRYEPVRPQPADPVPIDWDCVGCIIDDGTMEDAINKGFYWTAEQTGSFSVPPGMSAELCTASPFNRHSTYADMHESTCYCFDKKPTRVNRREQCEKPCYNNQGKACGGESRGSVKLTVY